ncbi:MAG: PEP-CTERM sorting domain-containing protein [Sedimentisphaerales bacterium]|nr:PEP-CTERM sorting domain-containing protein [Sedimentisphaerales bacterium]
MSFKNLICLFFIVLVSGSAMAAFSTAAGYDSTALYTGSGMSPIIGGLDHDNGNLYFGQGTDLMSLDLSDNSLQPSGILSGAVTNSLVARYNGTTYTSYATTYDEPYPYKMGYIDGSGNYQNQWNQDGIYDIAISPTGTGYIAANPAFGGSKIFEYDLSTGYATEVASIGGYAGGITFDSAGNLYYASQTGSGILKFSVDGFGVLDMSTYDIVLDIAAGYIGFDDDGNFYATTDWGGTFSVFDLNLGTKITDIAFGGIGQFVIDDESIYLLDTDWGLWATTVYEVTAVPEPATIILLGLGGVALLKRRGQS